MEIADRDPSLLPTALINRRINATCILAQRRETRMHGDDKIARRAELSPRGDTERLKYSFVSVLYNGCDT